MRSGEGFCRKNSIAPGSRAGVKSTPWPLASSGEDGMPTISTSASGNAGIARSQRTSVSPQATATRYDAGAWRNRCVKAVSWSERSVWSGAWPLSPASGGRGRRDLPSAA